METITVKERQTLFDIALEQYGTCEAVDELLRLNPDIANDPAALTAAGIDSIADKGFYLDLPVETSMQLVYDPDSMLRRDNILKELRNDITTYDYGTND